MIDFYLMFLESSKCCHLNDGTYVANLSQQESVEEEVVALQDCDSIVINNEDVPIESLGSSRVTSSARITKVLEYHMDSTLFTKDVWERYLEAPKTN